ncbi:hypothetical protein D3H35_04845 [Cohnella faecalis]|uniref:Uncharacterized protein n=1 Tax=Cohnella faecalis TaxID=2315694 RepID=A0A398CRL7_9BACL|nr:hypothetical protein D3H35_04845 [Cohnella faecalis]
MRSQTPSSVQTVTVAVTLSSISRLLPNGENPAEPSSKPSIFIIASGRTFVNHRKEEKYE